jgi:hypothetical protein
MVVLVSIWRAGVAVGRHARHLLLLGDVFRRPDTLAPATDTDGAADRLLSDRRVQRAGGAAWIRFGEQTRAPGATRTWWGLGLHHVVAGIGQGQPSGTRRAAPRGAARRRLVDGGGCGRSRDRPGAGAPRARCRARAACERCDEGHSCHGPTGSCKQDRLLPRRGPRERYLQLGSGSHVLVACATESGPPTGISWT